MYSRTHGLLKTQKNIFIIIYCTSFFLKLNQEFMKLEINVIFEVPFYYINIIKINKIT